MVTGRSARAGVSEPSMAARHVVERAAHLRRTRGCDRRRDTHARSAQQPGDAGARVVLARRHQAQVPARQQAGIVEPGDRAEDGHVARLFDGLARHRFVPAAGHLVEDDAGNGQGGSIAWQPRTRAAAVAVILRRLITSTTGARSSRARAAVLCVPTASVPSKRPRLPSITFSARPAPVGRTAWRQKPSTAPSGPARNVSRLRAGACDAHDSQAASM